MVTKHISQRKPSVDHPTNSAKQSVRWKESELPLAKIIVYHGAASGDQEWRQI